ncbi:MAG: hypothetical protein G8345_04765 [Magnetococcales bacterium]|nr:hypothetical protein [Magnetococcales bacterium]NGZ26182.1 hypothetical protein [Magnetococcales bacterium]
MKNIKYTIIISSLLAAHQVMAEKSEMSHHAALINSFQVFCTLEKLNFDSLDQKATLMKLKVHKEYGKKEKEGDFAHTKSWYVPLKTGVHELVVAEGRKSKESLQMCGIGSSDVNGEAFKQELLKVLNFSSSPIEQISPDGNTRKTLWLGAYGGSILMLDDATPKGKPGVILTLIEGMPKSNQADNGCSYRKLDALPSPNGSWTIQRAQGGCTNDEGGSQLMFAMLRPGEAFQTEKVFLKTNQANGKWDLLSAFAKWTDDQHLLIASPEGHTLKSMPSEVNNVKIQYVYYPLDPNKTKDPELQKQIEKKAKFKAHFETSGGFGVPGIGCNLTVDAEDGEHLDRLSLLLRATTTFAIKSYNPALKQSVLNDAYSSYDFQILARDQVQRPDKHATGAELIGFSPQDGKSTLWTYYLNEPPGKAPSGVFSPKWGFGYRPKDPQDILAIARQVKSGTAAIRLSYWLDNEIVTYTGEPEDQEPFDSFEKCIQDNAIFDTPRHVKDR